MEEMVTFKISGGFVTDQARDFVIEDRWEQGLDLVNGCISGSNYEIGVSILKGEKRFEGVNTLELVDEDPANIEGYLKQLDWMFSGICKYGNEYWRPYAYVDGWCANDLNRKFMAMNKYNAWEGPAPVNTPGKSADVTRWSLARCNFYMNAPDTDRAMHLSMPDGDVAVLWSQIRVPPLWMKTFGNWQEALDDFLQHRGLDHRGAHELRDEIKKDDEDDDYLKRKQNIVDNWDKLAEEQWQETYNKLSGVIDNDPHTLQTQNGWLSREGELIPCQYFEHDVYANVILERRYNVDSNYGGDDLLKRGWQKLQRSDWVTLYRTDWKVTQRQYDTIWDYSQEHNKRMPSELSVE